jgi:hypothetical protein
MRRNHAVPVLAVVALSDGVSTSAQDKNRFTLFDRTPRELWRPMQTDRPDTTEGPRTVDAGVFQLETGLAGWSRDRRTSDGADTEGLTLLELNLRAGVLWNAEVDVILTAWERVLTSPSGAPGTDSHGFGDVILRGKVNLWGNDAGETALAVMPLLVIPTGGETGSDEVGGGLIVPFAWDFAEGASLGAMGELDLLHDAEEDEHDLFFLQTVVLAFDITGPLGAYVEFVGNLNFDGGEYEAFLSSGLTWQLTGDLALDAGALVGLSRAAEDLSVFVGLSVRF